MQNWSEEHLNVYYSPREYLKMEIHSTLNNPCQKNIILNTYNALNLLIRKLRHKEKVTHYRPPTQFRSSSISGEVDYFILFG